MPLGFGSLCVLAKKQSPYAIPLSVEKIRALGVAIWGVGGRSVQTGGVVNFWCWWFDDPCLPRTQPERVNGVFGSTPGV